MNLENLSFSPAADRNKAPILAVLEECLPTDASVLEIASGTGQHAAHFASARPDWQWQPTDRPGDGLEAIRYRCESLRNVRAPLPLDVLASPWPARLGEFDAVYCANMIHIAPWESCVALMKGAAEHLVRDGLLILYGPFFVEGEPASPGNLAFDADLRSRDPAWGVRFLGQVERQAQSAGFALQRSREMPANNRLLVFQLTAK